MAVASKYVRELGHWSASRCFFGSNIVLAAMPNDRGMPTRSTTVFEIEFFQEGDQ